MSRMYLMRSVACAAVLMAAATMAAQKATTTGAREGWAAATMRCAKEPTEPARRECVDRALREADIAPEVRERQEQRDRAAAQAPAPTPAPAAQASPPVTPESARDSLLKTPAERAVAQVVSVSWTPAGMLVARTRTGEVWRQKESPQIRRTPMVGHQLTIVRTSPDGFTCSLPSEVSWPCERIR